MTLVQAIEGSFYVWTGAVNPAAVVCCCWPVVDVCVCGTRRRYGTPHSHKEHDRHTTCHGVRVLVWSHVFWTFEDSHQIALSAMFGTLLAFRDPCPSTVDAGDEPWLAPTLRLRNSRCVLFRCFDFRFGRSLLTASSLSVEPLDDCSLTTSLL